MHRAANHGVNNLWSKYAYDLPQATYVKTDFDFILKFDFFKTV